MNRSVAAMLMTVALMLPGKATIAAEGQETVDSQKLVGLPPSEEGAKAALESSPRHQEWAKIPLADSTMLNAFVVYPERKDKAPVVIVIHEVFGLTDWIRSVTDQLAGDGFLVIVPDLLSGVGPDGGGTEAFPDRDAVIKAIRELSDETITARLNATRAFATEIPAATKRFATVGFCWGGSRSFHYATVQPDLGAAVIFYGTSPADSLLGTVTAPVLGFYGGDDARVGATVPPAEAAMKKLGRPYTARTYEGAGHGFLRNRGDRDGANLAATKAAWPELVAFLRKNLEK